MTENKKELVSLQSLKLAGTYFGHKTSMWNPKMKSYISGSRGPHPKRQVHLIDLNKTKASIEYAYNIVKRYAEADADFIFVGTKKQAKGVVKEQAKRTQSYFMTERWLGGTLTNSRTIQNSVRKMLNTKKLKEDGYKGYTKKEALLFDRELEKLEKNLEGIVGLRRRPKVMIIADTLVDATAIKEAKKLGIRVIAIADTNSDPSTVDIAIPANDDSTKSIALVVTLLADAIAEARNGKLEYAYKTEDEIVLPENVREEKANNDRKPRRFNPRFNNDRNRNDSRTNNEAKPVKKEIDYDAMKVADLRTMAKNLDLKGYSALKKAELIELIKGGK